MCHPHLNPFQQGHKCQDKDNILTQLQLPDLSPVCSPAIARIKITAQPAGGALIPNITYYWPCNRLGGDYRQRCFDRVHVRRRKSKVYEPAHDAIGQIYPRGRLGRTVVRGPRRSERKVQFVDAEPAGSDGAEPLPVVLSPREHDGQELRDVPGM